MEENKNLNTEIEADNADIAESEKAEKEPKIKAPKKLKNQNFLKKGSYSLAITAAVIIGAIIINILTSALSDRFVMEYDMTEAKSYSMSKKNIEYIKSIEDEVTVTVCASEEQSQFVAYTGYWAEQFHRVMDQNASNYYAQTLKLLDKYDDYNDKITIEFVDPMADFSKISSKYPQEAKNIGYGDIIVSTGEGDKEKHKVVGFKDIYALYEDTTYASYGSDYVFYTVAGNSLETALTSGISYVLSGETKTVALYTGHSATDYSTAYETLLKENNYEVTVVSDKLINSISDKYDAIALLSPSADFGATELDAIAEFLDNDGNLGKGLIVFADSASPYLTELYKYLAQWGIVIEDGVVYEMEGSNHLGGNNTTFATLSTDQDDMLTDITGCITGNNVPMSVGEATSGITTKELLKLPYESGVIAPKGTTTDWSDANKSDGKSYASAVLATKSKYDSDNNPIASHVMVFSSINFVSHNFTGYNIDNETISILATDRVTGRENSGIVFNSKYIDPSLGEFTEPVTEDDAKTMRNIFMWVLPLLTLAVSIFVYFRRKNS